MHVQKGLAMIAQRQQQEPSDESMHLNQTSSKENVEGLLTFAPKLRAIFPKQMVVFVRMPGCSSLDIFARCFNNSPLITRSDNLVTTTKTALTVTSRSRGATSVKPVTYDDHQHSGIGQLHFA